MKSEAIALLLFASTTSVSCSDVPGASCYDNKGVTGINNSMTSFACLAVAQQTGCLENCGVRQVTLQETQANVCYNKAGQVNWESFQEKCKAAGGTAGAIYF